MIRRLLGLVVAAILSLPLRASAGPQDFQLYRLGDPTKNAQANANYRVFANQLGAAISSINLSPPETLGHSAFNFAFEYALAQVDTAKEIWPTAGNPASMMLMPSLHVRKGLPFSFELGSRFAYLQASRMSAATIEAKWALNEGFIWLPDLGLRGHGTRLIGTRDFNMTTAGFDIGLGKQIPIGGMVTLTPYAGWNIIYTNAISNVIDFAPDRSPGDAISKPTENTGVFDPVYMPQNYSNRFYFGMRFISYVVELGGEFSLTKTQGNRQVMTIGTKLGLDF